MFVSERGSPFTTAGYRKMVARLGDRSAAEREGMAGEQPLPFAADQLFLALVDVIAAQIADAATGSTGESLFTAELALLRRLQAELPTMIDVAEKAERIERKEDGDLQ